MRNDADIDVGDVDFREIDADDFDISEEELTALALAADPDLPVSADDVPFRSLQAEGRVVGMVLINAFGICVTNGFPQIF